MSRSRLTPPLSKCTWKQCTERAVVNGGEEQKNLHHRSLPNPGTPLQRQSAASDLALSPSTLHFPIVASGGAKYRPRDPDSLPAPIGGVQSVIVHADWQLVPIFPKKAFLPIIPFGSIPLFYHPVLAHTSLLFSPLQFLSLPNWPKRNSSSFPVPLFKTSTPANARRLWTGDPKCKKFMAAIMDSLIWHGTSSGTMAALSVTSRTESSSFKAKRIISILGRLMTKEDTHKFSDTICSVSWKPLLSPIVSCLRFYWVTSVPWQWPLNVYPCEFVTEPIRRKRLGWFTNYWS